MPTTINQDRLRELLDKHRSRAAKSQSHRISASFAKAGVGAKTLELEPGTSLFEAFTQAGFKVKADASSRETLAVYIEEVNTQESWTDVGNNTGVTASHFMSDFSDPVQSNGYYVLATNVKAGLA